MQLQYAWDVDRRIRLAHVGCGGHSYRNIFPCYPHCPVDLVATVDLAEERASACARMWGARQSYTDLDEMLEHDRPEAVVIVTDYDERGLPVYPALAAKAMRADTHVFIEKPPAGSSDEIRALMATAEETGKFTMVGFKKMFFPAIAKAKDIMSREEFGPATSLFARYPQALPPADKRTGPPMTGFLDHVVHPASIMQFVAGPVARLCYCRSQANGAVAATLVFRNGVIGALHLAAGQSGTSPLERLEVVGTGANVVVDNGCKLTYYRPGHRGKGGYRSGVDFIGPDEAAPWHWEPEFSLGGATTKSLNLLGYLPELLHFCQCVLDDRPPARAGLGDALEVMKVFEAFRGPEEQMIELPEG